MSKYYNQPLPSVTLAFMIALLPVPNGDIRAAERNEQMTAEDESRHTNRLIDTTSPYLLQHAHNPVDWYEWGEEALTKAKQEDKPIFLSIGYSACHWCHVMEHESFEDEVVAKVLNAHFVSIKVDREERPDIDEIYMAYTQALTGHGGWPMSVWLSPDGVPFHAGTYFPKDAFLQILEAISETWQNNRTQLTGNSSKIHEFFSSWSGGMKPAEGVLERAVIDRTAHLLAQRFDSAYGGISGGGTNKFPPSMAMELMLRVHHRDGEEELLSAVRTTLDNMARGGIYDHLGGGIARYSTDTRWLVPHFEKMLYDQALVSSIYLDAYQVTKEPLYAYIAADIFDYVIADLQSPAGGFYSTRDADSEGLEGAFYIWTVEQVKEILGEKEGKLFCAYYDVSEAGNWFESRGHAPAGPKNILHITKPPHVFAKQHGLSEEALREKIVSWRGKMLAARSKRVAPGLDDKVLTGWNGLMIASLAKGARVLNEPKYAKAAEAAAEFVLGNLKKDGRLLRTYRKGESRLSAYLSDYSFLIDGLLNLYEATFDKRWLDEAVALNDTLIEHYLDEDEGGFFFTADDAEKLIARSKNPQDGAIPSGNSVQAMNLLRLSVILDRKDYREKAEGIFRAFGGMAAQSPAAFEKLLCAVDFYHAKPREFALIGPAESDSTKAFVKAIYGRYLPNKVVIHSVSTAETPFTPLLKGKTMINDQPTAYLCVNYICQAPTTEPKKLAEQIGE